MTILEDKLQFFERNKLRYYIDEGVELSLSEKFRAEQKKENFDYHYVSKITDLDDVISSYTRTHINAIMFDHMFLKMTKKNEFDNNDITDNLDKVFLNKVQVLVTSIVDNYIIKRKITKSF